MGCNLHGAQGGYNRYTGNSIQLETYPDHNGYLYDYEIYVYGGGSTCPATLLQDATDASACQAPKRSLSQGEGQCPQVGNPISIASGNKFESATDYVGAGLLPLRIRRYYNSFDGRWRFSYSRSLEIVHSTKIVAWQDDGRAIEFSYDGSSWQAPSEVRRQLAAVGSGYELTREDDSVEAYDSTGKLTSITNRAGQTLTVDYDENGLLDKVTHFTGRQLKYGVDAAGLIASVTDPAGGVYRYTYDAFGMLLTVAYPDDTPMDDSDNAVRSYHYEVASDPLLLTGVTDENDNRYGTFSYANGRAVSTEHAGGVDRYQVSYGTDSKITVTNPLNRDTIYTFEYFNGRGRVTQVDGQPAAICGAMTSSVTYDANGFVASRTDNEGNVATFVHDAEGRETSRTEASGTPQARTITTTWHPTLDVPTQTVEPGQTIDMTYDDQGRLLTRTVTDTQTQTVPYVTTGNTRSVTYTYNAFGLVTTIDGPRTDVNDVTTFTYDGNGELLSTTNALGPE